jgi:hypothetical protein
MLLSLEIPFSLQDAGEDAENGLYMLVNLFDLQRDNIMAEMHKEMYIIISLFISAVRNIY